MKREIKRNIAAAAFAATATGLLLPGGVLAEDMEQQQQQHRLEQQGTENQRGQSPRAGLRADGQGLTENSQEEIRSTLGAFVQAALSNDFEAVVDNLAEPDRERIAKTIDEDKEISMQGRELTEKLEGRYSGGLDFKDDELQQSVFNVQFSDAQEKKATVTVPATAGMQEIKIPFVDEGTVQSAWRIDVPDTTDGEQLRAALNKHLEMINRQEAQLPSDRTQGAKRIAQHVLLSLNDINTQQRSGSQTGMSSSTATRSGMGSTTQGQSGASSTRSGTTR